MVEGDLLLKLIQGVMDEWAFLSHLYPPSCTHLVRNVGIKVLIPRRPLRIHCVFVAITLTELKNSNLFYLFLYVKMNCLYERT